MAFVDTIRQLWQRKGLVAIVLVLAVFAAILTAYQVSISPPGLHKRTLQVSVASSQILVDSPKSTLVSGGSSETFNALATRAMIYGQYLSSLEARRQIAKKVGVPPATIATAGPYSPETGQTAYESQPAGERANELLKEGAVNRLVFTAQEGVPILSVSSQAPNTERAIALANASFQVLTDYVDSLEAEDKPVSEGVTLRELGTPQGGTLGSSNGKILMALAFLAVFGLGCAAILIVPGFARRWRALDDVDRAHAAESYPQPVANAADAHAAHGFDATQRVEGDGVEPLTRHPAQHLG
jgi:capsular polysaccharide biosynthesis protein